MSVHKLRLERGWSQEQLAQHSGLSARTIQRIERGGTASLESLKCLAAVFETSVTSLVQEQTMTDSNNKEAFIADQFEREAIEYVQNLKGFHMNWICFLVIVPCLYVLNRVVSPDENWIVWVIIPWALAIGFHAIVLFGLFNVFGAKWEQREFQKRIGRRNR
jgi:transcriptional regulator with XRE-family HTH domain